MAVRRPCAPRSDSSDRTGPKAEVKPYSPSVPVDLDPGAAVECAGADLRAFFEPVRRAFTAGAFHSAASAPALPGRPRSQPASSSAYGSLRNSFVRRCIRRAWAGLRLPVSNPPLRTGEAAPADRQELPP